MHHGVIKINHSYRNQTLNLQIAKQCAPLLAGIKISNLLITHSTNINRVYEIFENTSIKIKFLYRQGDRVTLFLYKPEEICSYLAKEDSAELMNYLGYEDLELKNILELFAKRFTAYMRKGGTFPHEMGILLGYPITDVAGFIEHEGKNFLYSGYWKVYGDLYQALDTFEKYRKIKEKTVQLVLTGMTLKGIIQKYQNNAQIYSM